MATARMPDDLRTALEAYRTIANQLEGHKHPRYRAGALEEAQEVLDQAPLPTSLGAALLALQELFRGCEDVSFRGLLAGGRVPAVMLYVQGLASSDRLELAALAPLLHSGGPGPLPESPQALFQWLESVAIATSQTEPVHTIGEVVNAVLTGNGVLLVDGLHRGLSLAVRSPEHRAIDEPTSEPMIRGPREGFTENLVINTMLVRRRIRTPHLKVEQMILGRRTKTQVNILYLKDVADPDVVSEVRTRLSRIKVDGLIDSGMIEELIEDQPFSLFPQVGSTERPDRTTASLLEGRVAVLMDGSPFALLVPDSFWEFMQSSEDYYQRFWMGTFLRWLRYLFLLIALIAPSFYVAVTTYHQEMLPTSLLLSLASAREGIPFPALIEALLMEIFFEALREAGVRLPKQVGNAVSIVGALVIGQAAVQAGLASAPIVIIVASTGIASFTIPRYNLSVPIRLLRFPMMALAGTLGLFGIMVGLTVVLIHLCALRSFGKPYLQPLAPFDWGGLKDTLVRAPLWLMGKRPRHLEPLNPKRQASWLKPGPPGGKRS